MAASVSAAATTSFGAPFDFSAASVLIRRMFGRQAHLVTAGQHGRAVLCGTPQDPARERHDGLRREVPRGAVHAGGHRHCGLRTTPALFLAVLAVGPWRLAGEGAHDRALPIEDVECEALRLGLEVVVDEHAVEAADGGGRGKQRDVAERPGELAQRRQVVHHIEAAAVPGDGQ
ncbi:MAG TPA: hypothetical protein VMW48_02165 [Vicinamibacterales bacterium]|nr:hypothetical protein [Vicinamibacterales bacterium]